MGEGRPCELSKAGCPAPVLANAIVPYLSSRGDVFVPYSCYLRSVIQNCAIRRRGEVLREAVFDAALAEIAERGVRGASMDRIAKRAGTGKSALYRRWPNVRALALDVFLGTMEEALPPATASTGSLREDLLSSLTALSTELSGDLGVVLRELISEAAHDPTLSAEFQTRFGMRKQVELVGLLQEAMARGDIPTQQVDPYVLQVPAALVVHQLVLTGSAPSVHELEHIVDAIVLPLLNTSGRVGAPEAVSP
jgi:AcrR family transcriptional regulator